MADISVSSSLRFKSVCISISPGDGTKQPVARGRPVFSPCFTYEKVEFQKDQVVCLSLLKGPPQSLDPPRPVPCLVNK